MATKQSIKKKPKYSQTNPSPAQLRARRRFAAMAKARAKAARAAKRAATAKLKPKKRTTAIKKKTATARNPSVKGTTRYIVVKGNRKVNQVSYRLKSDANKVAKRYGGTVKAVLSGVSRKRNAEHRDASHPIEVRKYWRSGGPGYKSQWQRAHDAGQKQLFAVKNPSLQNVAVKQTYFRNNARYGRTTTLIEKSTGKKLAEFMGVLTKAEAFRQYQKKKKNGAKAAKAAFQEFTGKPSRKLYNSYAPKGSGAPKTLAAMGQLKKIHVKGRAALDFKGGAAAPTLARDPKTNQMFVLGKNYRLKLPRRNPTGMEDLGEITRIEYEAQKVHLGDVETVTYFHKMGEEGGEKPHLLVNQEGLVLIDGGDYTIGAEGIRN